MHLLFIALSLLLCSVSTLAVATPVTFGLHHTISHESKQPGTSSFVIEAQHPLEVSPTLSARPTTVYRPRSQAALEQARLRSLRHAESEEVEWDLVETLGPDVQDKHTLSQLARMTANAYALPGKGQYDIDPVWNNVSLILALSPGADTNVNH